MDSVENGCGRGVLTDDIKLFGLQPEWAMFRDVWRDFIHGESVYEP